MSSTLDQWLDPQLARDNLWQGGTPELLLVAHRFLYPEFIEIRGCVLLPWAYDDDNFEQWWSKLNGECSAIESVLNHTHVWDLFSAESKNVELDRAVAGLLVECWKVCLQSRFPDRSFDVTWKDDPEDYGPTVYVQSRM